MVASFKVFECTSTTLWNIGLVASEIGHLEQSCIMANSNGFFSKLTKLLFLSKVKEPIKGFEIYVLTLCQVKEEPLIVILRIRWSLPKDLSALIKFTKGLCIPLL